MNDTLDILKDRLDRAKAQVFAKRVAYESAKEQFDRATAELEEMGFDTSDLSTLDKQLLAMAEDSTKKLDEVVDKIEALEERLGPSKF